MPKTRSSLLIEATALVPWLAVAARVALGALAEGRMDVAGRCLCKSIKKQTDIKQRKNKQKFVHYFFLQKAKVRHW